MGVCTEVAPKQEHGRLCAYPYILRVAAQFGTHCPFCAWRRQQFFKETPSDAPPHPCDTLCPNIRAGLHEYPGQEWLDVIATGVLCSCSLPDRREGSTRWWVRIPLRIDAEHTAMQQSDCDYVFEGQDQRCDDQVLAWHNTRIEPVSYTHLTLPTNREV